MSVGSGPRTRRGNDPTVLDIGDFHLRERLMRVCGHMYEYSSTLTDGITARTAAGASGCAHEPAPSTVHMCTGGCCCAYLIGRIRRAGGGHLRHGVAGAYNSLPNRAESAHRWKHGVYGGGSGRLRARASGKHHARIYWGMLRRAPEWVHPPCRGRPAATWHRRRVVCGTDQNPEVPCAAPLPRLEKGRNSGVFSGVLGFTGGRSRNGVMSVTLLAALGRYLRWQGHNVLL